MIYIYLNLEISKFQYEIYDLRFLLFYLFGKYQEKNFKLVFTNYYRKYLFQYQDSIYNIYKKNILLDIRNNFSSEKNIYIYILNTEYNTKSRKTSILPLPFLEFLILIISILITVDRWIYLQNSYIF